MQTNFSPEQLADPAIATADKILRNCVHCGFCTATCPTYALLGDELDSPRGRIYMIKDMLEHERPATPEVVKHVDRCLSCLSCMTTCPSGVDYMHLVDHARAHIERTYKRPLADRALRRVLALVLPNPRLFRLSVALAKLGRPFSPLLPAKLRAMLALAPARLPIPVPEATLNLKPQGAVRLRVALLPGCTQQVLAPHLNTATARLLARHGCEVVVLPGTGCCGALRHHMGAADHAEARANILAWRKEVEAGRIDAIVMNASGCGTTVKDYGFLFRNDPDLAAPAAAISRITRDITELMAEIGLQAPVIPTGQRVAYHSACSLQHGQRVTEAPKQLLRQAGFAVVDVPEGHLCCGSAGTYNMLQPEIATQLRDRKVANIESTAPALIAAGNIGCMVQIGSGTKLPVVHTAELLDWATGGPRPEALKAS
ncbi:glycolate oxidase subunit GlcF [Acidocella aromatica]|uniref:Glycolate oxidase iron-sulfur subunit n=1 Tax=Acidocella aromatica TaxID=1303579 RepID=A0A840VKW0_9PROT|nr:glycolate oxidase subunit GlcF [Acidocella aromatica]MBB5372201.1 glycolate oxidase iron-sulfur subunit [Acidocella aromatica]